VNPLLKRKELLPQVPELPFTDISVPDQCSLKPHQPSSLIKQPLFSSVVMEPFKRLSCMIHHRTVIRIRGSSEIMRRSQNTMFLHAFFAQKCTKLTHKWDKDPIVLFAHRNHSKDLHEI
jgi:hypothetical protein